MGVLAPTDDFEDFLPPEFGVGPGSHGVMHGPAFGLVGSSRQVTAEPFLERTQTRLTDHGGQADVLLACGQIGQAIQDVVPVVPLLAILYHTFIIAERVKNAIGKTLIESITYVLVPKVALISLKLAWAELPTLFIREPLLSLFLFPTLIKVFPIVVIITIIILIVLFLRHRIMLS